MCGSMKVGRDVLRPGQIVPYIPIVGKVDHGTSRYAIQAGKARWAQVPWAWCRFEQLDIGRWDSRNPVRAVVPATQYWEKGCDFPIPSERGIAVIIADDVGSHPLDRQLYVVTRQAKLPEMERARDLGFKVHDRHPLLIPIVSPVSSRMIHA